MRGLLSRVVVLFRRHRLDADLDDDVRAHLALLADDYVRRGMTPDEARLAARRAFGGVEQIKERHRDQRGWRWAADLQSDLRYALRTLVKAPGFTAAAVLTLALGIGANVAIFSQLNAVLVRMLPVTGPEQLVIFSTTQPGRDPDYRFSFNTYETFQDRGRGVADIAATAALRLHVEANVGPTQLMVSGELVSGNYYRLLGVPAAAGRTLQLDDDTPRAPAVAVLAYGYWQRQFGGDPAVVGQAIRLNGYPFTIVGVSAPEFFGTHVGDPVDITMPLSAQPQVDAEAGRSFVSGAGADDFWLELLGRVRPDVTADGAQTVLAGVFEQIVPEIRRSLGPKAALFGNPTLALEPGSRGLSELRRRFSRPLGILMGVVVLVLLVACANVANLLLARNAARQREIAVRASLGAGRARLVRQFLTESVLLAFGGGAMALIVAAASMDYLGSLLTGGVTGALQAPIDRYVLAFTFGASALTALMFGTLPALGSSNVRLMDALRSVGSPVTARGRLRTRRWLVAAQLAVTVVLLVGAGLLLRTLSNLRQLDLGFDQQVLASRLEPRGSNQKWENEAHLRQLYADVLDRVRALPGVQAASLGGSTPLRDENQGTATVRIPESTAPADAGVEVRFRQIYPDYFRTLAIPIAAGRELTAADDNSRAPLVAVINESFARQLFGSAQAAIGRSILNNAVVQSRPANFEIVGVVADVRDRVIREAPGPVVYATFAQTPSGRGQMTLLVRSSGDERAIAASVAAIVRQMDASMPLRGVETIADRVRAATGQERLLALLSGLFGALALALAAVGLYGVIAYGVARRTVELGLRLALGARPSDVKRQVLGESLIVAVTGLGAGLVIAVPVMQALSQLWFGLDSLDAVTYLFAAALMVTVATVAAYLPARRASRVDPMVALRIE